MKRGKANDPDAMRGVGFLSYHGGDYDSARSAELGDVDAHYLLSNMHWQG